MTYKHLDDLIIQRISALAGGFTFVFAGSVRRECERLAEASGRDAFRVLDARLQALRKAGLIKYVAKSGWSTS